MKTSKPVLPPYMRVFVSTAAEFLEMLCDNRETISQSTANVASVNVSPEFLVRQLKMISRVEWSGLGLKKGQLRFVTDTNLERAVKILQESSPEDRYVLVSPQVRSRSGYGGCGTDMRFDHERPANDNLGTEGEKKLRGMLLFLQSLEGVVSPEVLRKQAITVMEAKTLELRRINKEIRLRWGETWNPDGFPFDTMKKLIDLEKELSLNLSPVEWANLFDIYRNGKGKGQ